MSTCMAVRGLAAVRSPQQIAQGMSHLFLCITTTITTLGEERSMKDQKCTHLNSILTLEEPSRVKDLDHGIPLQFAGPGAVVGAQPAPEHTALAQPLDEDAIAVGPPASTCH